jgi:hypothetical protein
MSFSLGEAFRTATAVVAGITVDEGGAALYGRMTDDELMAAQPEIAAYRQQGELHAAWWAGEVARRSRRDLGHSGLAQKNGFATPEAMVQAETGSTRTDAARLVAVGTMMADTEAADKLNADDSSSPFAEIPWLAPVARAVAGGTIAVEAAEAIRKGLGVVDPGVPAEKLLAAAEFLVGEATDLNADALFRRARQLRDELDQDGIARRAKTQHDSRSFKIWRQSDGMYRVSALLDAEDGLFMQAVYDQATSPRRGGPRFVDPAEKAKADALQNDERSTEQIAADALLALLRLGANADPGAIIIGHRRPAVRVMVTSETIKARKGVGHLDGHPDPVPFETVERILCESGQVGIKFDDDGQCINVGREQRLFTDRQRVGLSVRDGGCAWPDCDKPASWCEAHHIQQWKRDHGATDIGLGILLCRFHHLLLHNNRWEIIRADGAYWLKPPTSVDATQTLRLMPSKNPMMLRMFSPVGSRPGGDLPDHAAGTAATAEVTGIAPNSNRSPDELSA